MDGSTLQPVSSLSSEGVLVLGGALMVAYGAFLLVGWRTRRRILREMTRVPVSLTQLTERDERVRAALSTPRDAGEPAGLLGRCDGCGARVRGPEPPAQLPCPYCDQTVSFQHMRWLDEDVDGEG